MESIKIGHAYISKMSKHTRIPLYLYDVLVYYAYHGFHGSEDQPSGCNYDDIQWFLQNNIKT